MDSYIEKGTRIKYTLSLKAEIENIFNDDEINNEKKRNILLLIKEYCKDFKEKTGMRATTITLESSNFYLIKEALNFEYPDETHYSDSCIAGKLHLTFKGGCNLKNNTVIVSSWENIEPIIEG